MAAPDHGRRSAAAAGAASRTASRTAGQTASRPASWTAGRSSRWLAALLLASLALRFAYLLEIRDNPTFLYPTADPLEYHLRAQEILRGDLLGEGVFFHSSPLYPYFLAGAYALNGGSLFWTYALQGLVDSIGVLLLWWLARRLLCERVAWVAALLATGYQALLFFAGELLEITLVLALVTGGLLLCVISADATRERRPRDGLLFWAGLLLGVGALGKPNLLATIPFVALGWALQAGARLRRALRPALFLAAGVALVILPVTVRNATIGHDFVLTTSNGGINFFIGNNPEARGVFWVPPRMEADLGRAMIEVAELETGHALRPSEASNYWFRRGLDFIAGHPLQALGLTARKALLLLNHYEIPNHYDLNFFQRYSALLRWTPVRWGTVVPLALLGLVLAWPQRRRLALLYLFLAAYAVTLCAFFITARYRLPLLPFLLVFAAFAAVEIAARRPWRAVAGRRRLALVGAGLAAAILIVHLPLHSPQAFFAYQHGAIASVYKQEGRFDRAAEEYRRAVELAPRGVLFRNNLGVCLLELGDRAEGERRVREAIDLDPQYAPAWRNLGRILEARADTLAAIDAQRRAFATDPFFAEAGVDLARLLFARGSAAEAASVLRQVLARSPAHPHALWNLAFLLALHLDQPRDALPLLDRLLVIEPQHREALALRRMITQGS